MNNVVSQTNYLFRLDVGFAVGRHTPYKYIIINVHYLCTVKDDNSGNQLLVSRTPYVITSLKKASSMF